MGLMERDPDSAARRRAQHLASLGLKPSAIAARMRINRTSVYRLLDDDQAASAQASRAELVAAARPWAQNPWSAKDGA